MGEKKIGVLPYEFFDQMDLLREQHKIDNKDWSKLSGVPISRISAYRTRAKNRSFTVEKAKMLILGLEKQIGSTELKKELLDRLENESSLVNKAVIALMIGFPSGESEEDSKQDLEAILNHIMSVLKSKK